VYICGFYIITMYAYIEGTFSYKSPTEVYIDVGGVAYLVNISLNTFARVDPLEKGRLYTHLYVKEDAQTLYGFFELEEKQLFLLLISVSGIGPNTARIILSSMTPIEVRTAIVTDNDVAFKKVKGVGPKTAKRLILDLKDKVKKGGGLVDQAGGVSISAANDQALEALVALGFQRQKVSKTLAGLAAAPDVSPEELIKRALQQLT